MRRSFLGSSSPRPAAPAPLHPVPPPCVAHTRRLDPAIAEIVDHASFAAVYDYDKSNQQWKRAACEGPLYLVRRSHAPSAMLVLLNRKSPDNLVEPLQPSLKVECNAPYLMYRGGGGGGVRGIWFHARADYDRLAPLCERIVGELARGAAAQGGSGGGGGGSAAGTARAPAPGAPPRVAAERAGPSDAGPSHGGGIDPAAGGGGGHAASMDDLMRRLNATAVASPLPPGGGGYAGGGGGVGGGGGGGDGGAGAALLSRLVSQGGGGGGGRAPAPAAGPSSHQPVVLVSREHVRRALLALVVKDEFLDLLADALTETGLRGVGK